MYFPLNYDAITWVGGHNPPAHVKAYNNRFYSYWERALFQRACSVFDFTLPEEWQGERSDFFYWILFRFGYVMIARDERFGTFFQPAALGNRTPVDGQAVQLPFQEDHPAVLSQQIPVLPGQSC